MRLNSILAVWAVAAACARDTPVAPDQPAESATEQLATLGTDQRVALAVAITDARAWLLPSRGERDVATDAVAERFADLAARLERDERGALIPRLAAARRALEASAAEPRAERLIELAALALVLDGVEAVMRGSVPDAPVPSKQPHKHLPWNRSLP